MRCVLMLSTLLATAAASAASTPLGSDWPAEPVADADRTLLERLGAQPLTASFAAEVRRETGRVGRLLARHPLWKDRADGPASPAGTQVYSILCCAACDTVSINHLVPITHDERDLSFFTHRCTDEAGAHAQGLKRSAVDRGDRTV